uniref:Phenylalanine--tRNA ligase beta subunit, chloroplastic n=1 Tax=Leptocylindrus danicus TaxID=163516 RepID=A0A023HCF6_9STRA|nr:phenylalanine-tRNA ligase beta subunit [Leptocylindrus danicus]AGH28937.1 phenylalanine-tRNA ligase beta subunit [Leptocylindrus danicus]
MRISLHWLNELVNITNIELDSLIEKLTLGGFEVEDVLNLTIANKKDTILDISATANRADSLSVYGIGKEVSALLNSQTHNSIYSTGLSLNEESLKQIILDNHKIKSNDYSIFVSFTVKNLTKLTSPKWLQNKLLTAGLTPLNNLLDYQNYILLETGYPFEFYDLQKIQADLDSQNFELKIDNNKEITSLDASNGNTYNLSNQVLTVKADEKIISIGGIIPSNQYKYESSSSSLLIEGSIFNSKRIRQTSRLLGIRTERSARYEKDLTKGNFLEAYLRLLSLLKTQNENIECTLHTVAVQPAQLLPKIQLQYATVIDILGPNSKTSKFEFVTPNEISTYLERLDFNFSYQQKELIWTVQVPEERSTDIKREIDLIEEIGRLHGFNNFTTSLPKVLEVGKRDISYQTRQKLTSAFLAEGFTELMQYSLVNQNLTESINIINPLLAECSILRQSLLPGLLKTFVNNIKNSNTLISGFEYGHIFKGDISKTYQETEYIGGIISATKIKQNWLPNSKTQEKLSWFDAKGQLQNIFNKLDLTVYWEAGDLTIYEDFLHPYKTANLYLEDGQKVGVFGQVNPIKASLLNINSDVYLFELDFELVRNKINSNKLCLYKTYSTYPKIVKDLSFFIDPNISLKEIETVVSQSSTQLLKNIELLDVYKETNSTSDQVSICLQLTFQSDQKTLLTNEIESIVNNINKKLIKTFNVSLRT